MNFLVLCRLLLIIVHLFVWLWRIIVVVMIPLMIIVDLLLQRSQTIRSINLESNNMGSKAGRLLLEGVKVRSGGSCVCGVWRSC